MPTSPALLRSIDEFDRGGQTPARWVAGLSPTELNAVPVPGTWTMQQLVLHVLDSDLAAGHRFRRIVAEETPLLIAYDESLFAKKLAYEHADIAQVCELFRVHRAFTAAWLRTVDDASFERAGVHNQRGKVTLSQFVQIYVDHLTHHERFALAKRAALGRPTA
jgi:uncharacterized damage-inducible protein DinB